MKNDFNISKEYLLNFDTPILQKMRSLFTLRNIPTDESVKIICESFKYSKSVLLKHELAYVLGQMRNRESLSTLINVFQDESENEIVRHEAAEALGNFDFEEEERKFYVSLLEKYLNHPIVPLRQTAYLSFNKLIQNVNYISEFDSFDPAMPFNAEMEFNELKKKFLDDKTDLFLKYEILFFLRNSGTKEAIDLLGEGMNDSSELLKHEIAFVIGQISNKNPELADYATDFLIKELKNKNNHPMVRHECAETLGSINNDLALQVLHEHLNDECEIVKESCIVALDISEYKISDEINYTINI